MSVITNNKEYYTPTAKQKLAFRLMSTTPYTMLYGGSRSGKTFAAIRAIVVRALKVKSSHLIVRNIFNSAKISIWKKTLPDVIKITCPGLQVNWNKSDFVLEFPNGSEIWISGTDDKDRIEKVLGNEYSTIYANECSQISYEAIVILMTRLAENNELNLRFYFDCNPPSKRHWTYRLFIEGLDPQTKDKKKDADQYGYILMNPEDNRENLPEGYIEKTLDNLPKRQRDRFKYGLFQSSVLGALWDEDLLNKNRVVKYPDLIRIVVAVDPPTTSGESADECGIIVAGKDAAGHGYLLADYSCQGLTPKGWATEAVKAYKNHNADRIVAEVNNGGDLVEEVIRQVDPNVAYTKVHASRGKVMRAEPVAALDEQFIIHHVGMFDHLEDQMCEFTIDFDKKAMGYSPDRVDARVWAFTELLLADKNPEAVFGKQS